jgi:hypothetical protein
MDRRHVCLAALVAAPWLAIVGALLAGCGLLLGGGTGQAAAGGALLGASVAVGTLAGRLLGDPSWALAVRDY